MKNWWKNFFTALPAEVMFDDREGKQTEAEISEVFDQIKKKHKISKEMRVLDLCCGEGRHSISMAQRGHRVTGLDYTKVYLKKAKAKAEKKKVKKLDFVQADMKRASKAVAKNEFDLVTSLYNSFGYFDTRKEDAQVLTEVHQVLKPGGLFVINTLNGEGVKVRLKNGHNMGVEVKKNLFMIDRAFLDFKKMTTQSEWTIIDARKKRSEIFRGRFSQNVYTHKELKALLKKAGFRILTVWGRLEGGEFSDKTSWHQTILAQKIK